MDRFPQKTGLCMLLLALGCALETDESPDVMRLATTTSTRDSGLLEVLLPPFEREQGIRVDVVAVGTGKALQLGKRGDADALLVHARPAEDAFMADGFGVRRVDVMTNHFEILGPQNDPAGIKAMGPIEAIQAISRAGHRFVSRSDESGTHQREQALWQAAGGLKAWPEYIETGQGMGATLVIANELQAYVLCDRGTYLHFKHRIDLIPLVTGAVALENPYGATVVNPAAHAAVRDDLAHQLLDYLISDSTQQMIGEYRLADEALFHPAQASE